MIHLVFYILLNFFYDFNDLINLHLLCTTTVAQLVEWLLHNLGPCYNTISTVHLLECPSKIEIFFILGRRSNFVLSHRSVFHLLGLHSSIVLKVSMHVVFRLQKYWIWLWTSTFPKMKEFVSLLNQDVITSLQPLP